MKRILIVGEESISTGSALASAIAARGYRVESAPKEAVEVRLHEPSVAPVITWSIPSFREPKPYGKKSRRALRRTNHD